MPLILPWGFDRGDGVTNLPAFPLGSPGSGTFGTPTPANSQYVDTTPQFLAGGDPQPDSPTIERSEQATFVHKEKMTWSNGLAYISVLSRGTVVVDSVGNIYRLLSATLQHDSIGGDFGVLTTVCESVSFDVPPDEFQVNTVDLGVDIIKHPRYFGNLYPTAAELGTTTGKIKESIIRAIQTYRDSPFFPTADNLTGLFNGLVHNLTTANLSGGKFTFTFPNANYQPQFNYKQDTNIQDITSTGIPTYPPAATANGQTNDPTVPVSIQATSYTSANSILLALAAAQEIITKIWRMEDTPYLAGIEVKWSQYYFLPPIFNLGSYLEDPTFIIPNYFMQPDRALGELPPRQGISFPVAGADNIFKLNASINPQDFSNTGLSNGVTNISWLRKADELDQQRTWFKITHTWIGSPIGYWDLQLYGATARPSQPSDYVTFS